uniref:RAB30, member RAS oncogene family n=1 Tax=Macrostomum lignano TaxID=282301 RepID=A0A1I8FBS2_9PLAT
PVLNQGAARSQLRRTSALAKERGLSLESRARRIARSPGRVALLNIGRTSAQAEGGSPAEGRLGDAPHRRHRPRGGEPGPSRSRTFGEANRRLKDQSDIAGGGVDGRGKGFDEIVHILGKTGDERRGFKGRQECAAEPAGFCGLCVWSGLPPLDDVEIDEEDGGEENRRAKPRKNRGELDLASRRNSSCASVAALAASEAVRSRCLSPPPVKETAEIATMEVRESPEGAGDDEEFLGPESLSEAACFRVFKVVFIGDSGVGKSSVIHRLCQDAFKSTFAATIGIDFQVKAMELEGQVIALQLWNTAGQERFRSITKQYFRKADGIVIVYDVTSAQSYLHLREWLDCIQEGDGDGASTCWRRLKKAATEVAGSARAVEAQAAQRLADECSDSGKAAPALFFLKSAPRAASPLAKPSSSLPCQNQVFTVCTWTH